MPSGIRSRRHLYYTQATVARTLARRPPDWAQGLVQDMQYRMGISIFAAVATGLAVLMLWSQAEAAEATIRSFSFDCETPDGRVVKPLHGDVEGITYTDLPAQRAQCLGTIDRKIALCWENTQFASEAENQELADCLPVFRDQARACVGHFSFERSKCGTEDPAPVDDVAGEPDEPALETTLEGRHRVKPGDRLMIAREAANVRTGPGPDYDIVGTVLHGDELHVTGEVRGRDWMRVAYPRSGDEAFRLRTAPEIGSATAAHDGNRVDHIGGRDVSPPPALGPELVDCGEPALPGVELRQQGLRAARLVGRLHGRQGIGRWAPGLPRQRGRVRRRHARR